ncbi:MAG: extracellular solute-binding protein [Gammaproteobacteria bacterium]|jgi:putative spermidine/putrescine transport system substrate-binding protein|nr:extracellular solute-binding protein [Gammaproteobacteria bacterium]
MLRSQESRIVRRLGAALVALLLAWSPAGRAAAERPLTVVSWDGAYVKSQVLGFIRPFERATGRPVEVVHYDGGIDEIRNQVRAWNVRWDVVDLELFDAIRACDEGLLVQIDAATLPPAPDGTPATEDFVPGSLGRCGVGNIVAATVVAYDAGRHEGRPGSLEDFFDVKRFPGRRGMRRSPKVNLEWALLADGVAPDRLYAVLDTEAGVDRAFDVLTRLKPHIEWWTSGVEAVQFLESGEVAMSSVYSGRVYDAVQRGTSLEILWDHQVWFYDVWGIPRNGPNEAAALEFVRFATSTRSQANQMRYIPYGPVRRSALPLIEPRIREMLPTAPANMGTAIEGDAEWWSKNLTRMTRRFERWLDQPVMVPRDLPH